MALLVAAAVSQIALYTLGRRWILDVPPSHAPPAGAGGYLDGLVAFHALTIVALAALILRQRWRPPR